MAVLTGVVIVRRSAAAVAMLAVAPQPTNAMAPSATTV
jgi:hypothetical protein